MSHRFYVDSPITDKLATLAGTEAHHLLHVLRARAGEEVTLFDGNGAEFRAVVRELNRQTAQLEVVERLEIDRELPFALSLAVALPKGDRQKLLVEKLTELGVGRLVPLRSERSVAQPKGSALDRLRRSVIEASKQCRRNRLMEIAEPISFHDFLEKPAAATARWIAHPAGETETHSFGQAHGELAILVGPEGGFSDAEVAAAREADWCCIDLGPRILRIETAAIALAALAATSARP
ncbi:MAG: 16S rRNA (uracil(1498)-N(3))-methyltransferase [Planctomycetales bacterium]|nr:16S rRNA (uracil(1498)-N(3))-methyltransferase [Planctomycetales bacterium]